MRKSIFFKLALIIIPIVLILEVGEVFLSYCTVYDTTLEKSTDTIEKIAEIAVDNFKYFNPQKSGEGKKYSEVFDSYCEMFDLTYIFAMEIDVEERSEKYLAIGFGKNASKDAKKTRYPEIVVKGKLTDEEIDVYNGKKKKAVVHELTQFDDSLICYYPVNEIYNYEKHKMEKNKKPFILGTEVSFSSVMADTQNRFKETAVYELGFTFIMIVTIFLILHFRINGPVKTISKRMKHFVSDRDKGFEKLEVKGKDELAEMSRSFNTMAEEIDNYIEDIDLLTKEKHTQEAELGIARRIQTGLLKPPRYKNDSISINACMHAAKNVGGDLYDYQVLDDGRVFIAVADVSGKGISAALFMSRAITLLHQYALHDYSPSRMLFEFNNTLAEQNPNGLFITAFVAVYNPETGELSYSNAGHNRPYIVSDKLIMLDEPAGIAAGAFSDNEYEQETFLLKPDDVVFLYTDGVNEASNRSKELFGTKTLENELKNYIGNPTDSICDDIMKTVRKFSDGAVQSDDITILTMRVGQNPIKRTITQNADVKNLAAVYKMINTEQSFPDDIKAQLRLIAEEIFVNICSYAYGDNKGEVTVELDIHTDRATLTFIDSGRRFNPTADVIDIEDYDHENSIGGLGRYIAFEIADDYSYKYENNKNILTVTKKYI